MKFSVPLIALSLCILPSCDTPLEQVTPPERPTWEQVSATQGITCGVDSAERLYCWSGGDTEVKRIAADQSFQAIDGSCALTEEGIAYCWSRGNLPEQLDDTHWATVSGELSGGCGIELDGGTYCWGEEYKTPREDVRLPPARVSNDQGFEQLSAGSRHACGLTSDGKAYCWYVNTPTGNSHGVLGVVDPPSERLEAVAVETDQRFNDVVVDQLHTCAINEDNEAYCWGTNLGAQLGIASDSLREGCTITGPPAISYPIYWCSRPQKVTTDRQYVAIEIGNHNSCGLDVNGRVSCWGSNVASALGVESAGTESCRLGGYYDCTYQPIPISTDREFTALSTGFANNQYCAIEDGGEVYCWGGVGEDGLPAATLDLYGGLPTPTKIPDPPPLES